MALTNVPWSTTSGTGWGFTSPSDGTEFEFLAGGLHLKAGETYALATTPAKATAAYGRIHSFDLTYEEEATASGEYRHQILVSFDGGVNYWGPVGNALVKGATTGFTLEQLRAWREWPTAAEVVAFGGSLKLQVAMFRLTDAAADGILATLSVNHGTETLASSGTTVTIPGEPNEGDALSTFGLSTGGQYHGLCPDWPLEVRMEAPVVETRFESGYVASHATGTLFRDVFGCKFGARQDDTAASIAERTGVLAFLKAHTAASFEWTPPGRAAAKAFVSSWPEASESHFSARVLADIRATWTEVPT